jgi:hypothetical protein
VTPDTLWAVRAARAACASMCNDSPPTLSFCGVRVGGEGLCGAALSRGGSSGKAAHSHTHGYSISFPAIPLIVPAAISLNVCQAELRSEEPMASVRCGEHRAPRAVDSY